MFGDLASMRHFSFEHQYVTPLVTRDAPQRLQLKRTSQHEDSEPVTPADGGLAGLPTVCCVLVVMGFRAAAEFQRSACISL
jgi:hypothetical protein